MAHIDIFKGDAFSAMELGEAIRIIPNQWGTIGEMGLFSSKSIRGTKFSVEMKNGVIQLVGSSERGTPLGGQRRAKRDLVDFRTERFGKTSEITADDIDNIRAYGSVTGFAGRRARGSGSAGGSARVDRHHARIPAVRRPTGSGAGC